MVRLYDANELQQGWFVPHDIPGVVELMGGTERVIADLDTMFDKTPTDFLWNAYYNHANERITMCLSCTIIWDSRGKPRNGLVSFAIRRIRIR